MTYYDAINSLESETISELHVRINLLKSASESEFVDELIRISNMVTDRIGELKRFQIYREVEAQLKSDEATITPAWANEYGIILEPVEYTDLKNCYIVLKPGRRYNLSYFKGTVSISPNVIGAMSVTIPTLSDAIKKEPFIRITTDTNGRELYFDDNAEDGTWKYIGWKPSSL